MQKLRTTTTSTVTVFTELCFFVISRMEWSFPGVTWPSVGFLLFLSFDMLANDSKKKVNQVKDLIIAKIYHYISYHVLFNTASLKILWNSITICILSEDDVLNGWLEVLQPLNSISIIPRRWRMNNLQLYILVNISLIISGWWIGDNERLCALNPVDNWKELYLLP